MKHILHVVGARPNFMKLAPVLHALAERGVRQHVVHTGQHYDVNMSDAIFRELRLPEPDVNLGVGSGSHAEQTAEVLVGMERCLGDLQARRGARLRRLELDDGGDARGRRRPASRSATSRRGCAPTDRRSANDVNRIVTDRLSTWHFTPSADADENLLAEGTDQSSIPRVGNVMIDTLTRLLPGARPHAILQMFGLMNGTRPEAVRARHAAHAGQRRRRTHAGADPRRALRRGGADAGDLSRAPAHTGADEGPSAAVFRPAPDRSR